MKFFRKKYIIRTIICLLITLFLFAYEDHKLRMLKVQREGAFRTLYALMLDAHGDNDHLNNINDLENLFGLERGYFEELAYGDAKKKYRIDKIGEYVFAESDDIPINFFKKDKLVVDIQRGIYWSSTGSRPTP